MIENAEKVILKLLQIRVFFLISNRQYKAQEVWDY